MERGNPLAIRTQHPKALLSQGKQSFVSTATWILSKLAFAGVVYLCMIDTDGDLHTSLVVSKTKVAPIKRLSIPRLELCGAHLLAQLLHHCKEVFGIPSVDTFAWTDSTIVLNWLVGNPRRFKAYVGNRVSHIVGLIPPERWAHVDGKENPADCASRGLFPSELVESTTCPNWLKHSIHKWPKQPMLTANPASVEGVEICLHIDVAPNNPVAPIQRYSSYSHAKRDPSFRTQLQGSQGEPSCHFWSTHHF